MALRELKYGSFGFAFGFAGLRVNKTTRQQVGGSRFVGFAYASQEYGQQTTDLWAVADCSPLSVDCSLPKKPKIRRCRPLPTPVSPRIPPIGEYGGGQGPTTSSRLRGFAFGFAGQRTIGFEQ